jgi:hypothetical protein
LSAEVEGEFGDRRCEQRQVGFVVSGFSVRLDIRICFDFNTWISGAIKTVEKILEI